MTEFKYFYLDGDGRSGVFRFPKNEKRLYEQTIEDVEKFDVELNSWKKGHRETLLNQLFKGWFDEQSDEITEAEASELIEKLRAKTGTT